MFIVTGGKRVLAAMLLAGVPALFGAPAFDDIPGDGSIRCSLASNPLGTTPACDGSFLGSVSASAGAVLTGSLQLGGSSLQLGMGNDPVFVLFEGGAAPNGTVGPLGLNPLYNPDASNSGLDNAERDVTRPVTGQLLNFTITNAGPQAISSIAFYLLLNAADFNGSYPPRNDGLTFGAYCTGMIDALNPEDGCNTGRPENFALLSTPTGPGTVNALDLSATTDTFGDLLRFSGFNLAPSQSAEFSFFVSDYKPTRRDLSNGLPPSESFALAVVPTTTITVIPEPGTVTLMLCAAAAGLVWRRRRA